MIEARDITKSYGTHVVLDNASLRVSPGECAVLSGDNGSGKTTLLHVLAGLRQPDDGGVSWKQRRLTGAGHSAWRRAREVWGFLPQELSLPANASVGQLLRFHARLRKARLETARRWLEKLGLAETHNKRVAALSGGMRQRLGIVLAMFFEPELIVMDEPTSSLDPSWRSALTQLVDEQARRGTAILVTSQLHDPWGSAARYLHCAQGRVVENYGDRETMH